MSNINYTPQLKAPADQLGTPTELIPQCNPKPEEEDWKAKYEALKAEYDDLRIEYELLQDKCNKMVSRARIGSRNEESLLDQFNHGDGTMEDDDTHSVWHDDIESEV